MVKAIALYGVIGLLVAASTIVNSLVPEILPYWSKVPSNAGVSLISLAINPDVSLAFSVRDPLPLNTLISLDKFTTV